MQNNHRDRLFWNSAQIFRKNSINQIIYLTAFKQISVVRKKVTNFKRTVDELEQKAVKWWPAELSKKEASVSIIPVLLKTQEAFISILKLTKDDPKRIFEVLKASNFPANLFLKHLVVLSDFGGEQIQRLNSNFGKFFPANEALQPRRFDIFWNGKKHEYFFKKLPFRGVLDNKRLGIDGPGISENIPLDDLRKDMIMILLFGSNSTDPAVSEILNKCEVGNLLGNPDGIEKYVKQKYIWVSRITGGAQANTLGQVAQQYVIEFLKTALPENFEVIPSGHIEGVTHTEGRTLTKFDIVVKRNSKSVAIEVSFQVTTNSVIERKAGQAKARYDMIKATGNYIAYIIDGAGNFQRRSAVSTICAHSDCTVAFSDEEFKILVDFIKEVLG